MQKVKKLFKNKKLFEQALTHKSWINEHPGERESNERLEFLGDAVLEFSVSNELYLKFPDKEEGYLTALRANLVNTKNLAELAESLKVGNELFLSKGEEEGGGRKNPSLLANTIEAIIGALFLDQGLKATTDFIRNNLLSDISIKLKKPLKDSKSRLQEKVQARGLAAPKYKVAKESGPDHAKEFIVKVFIDNMAMGTGTGKNKGEAEQEAAKVALKKLL